MAAVLERLNLSGGKLLLALAIANHADADGTSIFPSVPTLAFYTRQDVRTVQRQLAVLVSLGWLVLVRERVPVLQTNEYRISPAWVGGGNLPGLPDREQRVRKYRRAGSPIHKPPAIRAESGDTAMSPNSSGPVITHHSSFEDGGTDGVARRRVHATVNGLSASKKAPT